MSFAWFLSLCVGFLSLSQEILWMRYVSFANLLAPRSFPFVLAIYLFGIAYGALAGKELCAKNSNSKLYTISGRILIGAGILDMLGPLIAPFVVRPTMLAVPLIYLCARLKGIIFPIAHQLGAVQGAGQTGKTMSRVYFMNIMGSTLGPLLTGFWLLDHASLQTSMLLMGWLTIVLGVICLAKEMGPKVVLAAAAIPVLFLAMFLQPNRLASQLACTYVESNKHAMPVNHLIETKSGIIHTIPSDHGGGDFTLGGNMYDGRDNIDPRVNSNILQRIFVLAALRPQPADVLVIGLSSGAWARILTGFPDVKNIDVVEINPGYLDLIKSYPNVAPLLRDPRVHIHIDDGRRWIKKRDPDKKYDLIVMNNTFNWRAYSTNLLSYEFLKILKAHVKPGGVLAYNTTGSPDVLKTAEAVFPYAFRYLNFVIASDEDFRLKEKTGRDSLLSLTRDGKPVFDRNNKADMDFINETLAVPFYSSSDDAPRVGRKAEVITDWNMITEFKYGPKFLVACSKE